MKSIKIVLLCFIMISVLPSCSSNVSQTRNSGILANDEAVSSVKQELEDMKNSILANDGNVFWTPSGTIWHGSLDCSYLANSKTIYHGTVEEAKLEGKERACEKCAKTNVDRIYESLEKNEIHSGDVFFTRNGESYHQNINCEEILGADKIYYSDIETAENLGKSDSCDKCKNNK